MWTVDKELGDALLIDKEKMERSIPESIPRVPIPVNHLHASQVGA
jgi:hypothetical protein